MKRNCLKAFAVCLMMALWLLPAMVMAAAPSKSDKAAKMPDKGVITGTSTPKAETKPAETKAPEAKAPETKESEKKNADTKPAAPKTSENKQGTSSKKPEPVLRVGLAEGQTSAVFTANNDFVVREGGGKGLAKYTHKDKITITVKNRQLLLNGKAVSAKKIVLKAPNEYENLVFSYNDSKYRGTFEIVLKGGSFTVINLVKLDDYVGGVINEEMGEGWPAEALKAQAVAARTFALYTVGEEKHSEDGYDVCTTTHCQVYGGVSSESRDALAAVSATRGEVMTYNGEPIYAAFHASSGGRTAASGETGTDLPYLKSRPDPEDSENPNQEWKISVPVKKLVDELRAAGYNVGTLKRIEISPLDMKGGKLGKDRFSSYRVKSVKFVGTLKTVDVPGTKLRWEFDLHSTLFDICHGSGKSMKPNKTGKIDITNRAGETVTFAGAGWGHGLGLSQWGARGMAEKYKYRDILARYYTDVKLEKLF